MTRPKDRFAAEAPQLRDEPVLFVDVDGVLSLWGFDSNTRPEGTFHNVDGVMHFLSSEAGKHLLGLNDRFELVWCTGWEEKADEHLPYALSVPRGLPFLSFDRDAVPEHAHPSMGWTLRVLFSGVALWGLPVLLLFAVLGAQHVFTQEAVFFSKMAVVTFGGAYAVLAYMTQQAVERYGWLSPGEMVQGLALAETTPGPLILVLTYVGFLGAYRDPGSLDPLMAGVFGATLSTWVTFVPCFLWIFLGAPYIERLRGNRALSAALTGITAAVVGVILNLSIWFALHVLFADGPTWSGFGLSVPVPEWASIRWPALLLGAAAMLALLKFHVNLMWVLAACAASGLILRYAGLVV